MNREKIVAAGIDYDMGLRRFAGKVELYEKYLLQFLQEPNFEQLRSEMNAEEYENAFRTAHALKGVTGTLSLDKLYKALCELVEALRAGKGEEAKVLMVTADKEYEDTVKILRDAM